MLDITDRRSFDQTVAQKTYRELGPLPIPFELEFDSGQIELGRKYVLEATVTVNGFAALRTPKPVPVLETRRQERVTLQLEPVRR